MATYLVKKETYKKPLIIVISFLISIYLLFALFAGMLTYLNNMYQNNLSLHNYYSKILFILSFVSIIIAILYTKILDKNNWAKIQAKLTNASTIQKYILFSPSITMKTEYTYTYNNKRYFKKSQLVFAFDKKEEMEDFLNDIKSRNFNFLDIYVFKRFPKISSETKKINFYQEMISFSMACVSIFLLFFGILFQAILKDFAKIVVVDTANGTDTSIAIIKPISNFPSIFDISSILTLILILIVITLYIFQTSRVILKNKFLYGTPTLDPQCVKTVQNQVAYEKYCSYCNSLNEPDSMYCFNCGERL